MTPWDKAMMRALELDGEKLRALTGEDYGPIWLDDDEADARELAEQKERDDAGTS